MPDFFATNLSLTQLLVGALLGFLLLTCTLAVRRVIRLEKKLVTLQRNFQRDLNMVNQGAIGVGRRFAVIEKRLAQPASVAEFKLPMKEVKAKAESSPKTVEQQSAETPVETRAKAVKQSQPQPKPQPKALPETLSQAEKALSAWVNAQKSA